MSAIRLVFLSFVLSVLVACSGDDLTPSSVTFVPPTLGFDFPPARHADSELNTALGALLLATDGDQLTAYGVADGHSSVVESLMFDLDESQAVGGEVPLPPFFYWEFTFSALSEARSDFSVIATDADSSAMASVSLAVGSSWMLERGLQYDSAGNRGLILDAAQKVLLALDLNDGSKMQLSGADNGSGVALELPEDMAIDAVAERVLVVDSRLGALLSVDLNDGERAVISDGETPDTFNVLLDPVAIAIDGDVDTAASVAYVVDRQDAAVVGIDLATGARNPLSAASTVDFLRPVDIVLQATEGRLLVADSELNAIVAVNISSGERTLLSDPQANEEDAIGFSAIKNILLSPDESILYVSDTGLNFIIEVDVDPVSVGYGQRTLLSSYGVPDIANPLRYPTAMAIDAGIGGNPGRLLVTDNMLGVTVTVDLSEGESRGQRDYISGGATVAQSEDEEGNVLLSASGDLAVPPLWSALECPAYLVLDQSTDYFYAVDQQHNTVLFIDSFGFRGEVTVSGEEVDEGEEQVAAMEFSDPQALLFDPAGGDSGRLLLADIGSDQIIAIDLSSAVSGTGSVVSAASAQLPLSSAVDLALEGDTLYVLDSIQHRVIAIDLANDGSRIVLGGTSSGPALAEPTAMALDVAGQQLLVSEEFTHSVIAVNTADGQRSTWADYSGALDGLLSPLPMAVVDLLLDNANDRLLLLDRDNASLLEINSNAQAVVGYIEPTTQNIDNTTANRFVSANSMVFNPANDRLYVLDEVMRSLYLVDLKDRDGNVDAQRLVFSRGVALNGALTP